MSDTAGAVTHKLSNKQIKQTDMHMHTAGTLILTFTLSYSTSNTKSFISPIRQTPQIIDLRVITDKPAAELITF